MNNLDILHAYWHARRSSDGSEPRKGLSKGVVAVIVIIVLLLLITLAGAVVWRFGMLGLGRWKRVRKEEAVRRKRVARRSVLAADLEAGPRSGISPSSVGGRSSNYSHATSKDRSPSRRDLLLPDPYPPPDSPGYSGTSTGFHLDSPPNSSRANSPRIPPRAHGPARTRPPPSPSRSSPRSSAHAAEEIALTYRPPMSDDELLRSSPVEHGREDILSAVAPPSPLSSFSPAFTTQPVTQSAHLHSSRAPPEKKHYYGREKEKTKWSLPMPTPPQTPQKLQFPSDRPPSYAG